MRKLKLGVQWVKDNPQPPPAVIDPEALWRQAMRAVPEGIPFDAREDLINDILVMRLEGDERPWSDLLKIAKTRRNQMMGAFKERSVFDTIGGTELRLIDTFEAGSSF